MPLTVAVGPAHRARRDGLACASGRSIAYSYDSGLRRPDWQSDSQSSWQACPIIPRMPPHHWTQCPLQRKWPCLPILRRTEPGAGEMLAVDDFLHQIQGQVVVVIGGLEADAGVVSRQFE